MREYKIELRLNGNTEVTVGTTVQVDSEDTGDIRAALMGTASSIIDSLVLTTEITPGLLQHIHEEGHAA